MNTTSVLNKPNTASQPREVIHNPVETGQDSSATNIPQIDPIIPTNKTNSVNPSVQAQSINAFIRGAQKENFKLDTPIPAFTDLAVGGAPRTAQQVLEYTDNRALVQDKIDAYKAQEEIVQDILENPTHVAELHELIERMKEGETFDMTQGTISEILKKKQQEKIMADSQQLEPIVDTEVTQPNPEAPVNAQPVSQRESVFNASSEWKTIFKNIDGKLIKVEETPEPTNEQLIDYEIQQNNQAQEELSNLSEQFVPDFQLEDINETPKNTNFVQDVINNVNFPLLGSFLFEHVQGVIGSTFKLISKGVNKGNFNQAVTAQKATFNQVTGAGEKEEKPKTPEQQEKEFKNKKQTAVKKNFFQSIAGRISRRFKGTDKQEAVIDQNNKTIKINSGFRGHIDEYGNMDTYHAKELENAEKALSEQEKRQLQRQEMLKRATRNVQKAPGAKVEKYSSEHTDGNSRIVGVHAGS